MVVDVKRWSHPQDFVALAAGVYAALSPIWTTTTTAATWTVVVLGVVTAALAGLSLARPGMVADGLMAVMSFGPIFFAKLAQIYLLRRQPVAARQA